jgi:hypothetical protein
MKRLLVNNIRYDLEKAASSAVMGQASGFEGEGGIDVDNGAVTRMLTRLSMSHNVPVDYLLPASTQAKIKADVSAAAAAAGAAKPAEAKKHADIEMSADAADQRQQVCGSMVEGCVCMQSRVWIW